MTLYKFTKETIQQNIKDFKWYVKEIGVAKAKELCMKSTCFTEVKRFINDYQEVPS